MPVAEASLFVFGHVVMLPMLQLLQLRVAVFTMLSHVEIIDTDFVCACAW